MRRARIIQAGGGVYHIMSRVVDRRRIIVTQERERFQRLMRSVSGFCGVDILTHAILGSHFHILLYVPERREVSDALLIERMAYLYDEQRVSETETRLRDYRSTGLNAAADQLKAQYTYRMYDLGEFCKTLLQRFSQSYNRRHGRTGTLWEQRYRSVVVEFSARAVQAVAAYIDLNAVRAGIVTDPKDYRYCGYGDALGGSKPARRGITTVMSAFNPEAKWHRIAPAYRKLLFAKGEERLCPNGTVSRPGFSRAEVQKVLDSGGKLPIHVLLRCRIRYFSDGMAIGSREFVNCILGAIPDAPARAAPRPMEYGDWNGLCTARNLRGIAISLV